MNKIIFASPAYTDLAHQLALLGGYEIGAIERKIFPDGERYLRITHEVVNRDVIYLAAAFDDSATMESFDMACGLVKLGIRRLDMIIPYFGYSTMERAVKKGEIVTAKNRARLFSAIPPAAYGNRFYAIDLHTGGLLHYFEGSTQVFHIYAKKAIIEAAQRLGGEGFVLASTDAGRAKWVESLANDMQVSASFVFKKRLSGSKTAIRAVSAQVQDRFVVIYDDMIRTGGSLLGAAKAYMDAGAQKIAAIATHGVFPGNAIERLHQSGLFQKIIVTNSHPRAVELQQQYPDFLEVIGLESILFAELG